MKKGQTSVDDINLALFYFGYGNFNRQSFEPSFLNIGLSFYFLFFVWKLEVWLVLLFS